MPPPSDLPEPLHPPAPGRSLARHGPPSVPAANKAAAVPALSAVFYSLNMLARGGGGGGGPVCTSVSQSVRLFHQSQCLGCGLFFRRRFQLDGRLEVVVRRSRRASFSVSFLTPQKSTVFIVMVRNSKLFYLLLAQHLVRMLSHLSESPRLCRNPLAPSETKHVFVVLSGAKPLRATERCERLVGS